MSCMSSPTNTQNARGQQVRREALQTLASLVATVLADHAAAPEAGTFPEQQQTPTADSAPVVGSGALKALSMQRPRLLAVLDSCRYDQIAAVRVAAAEARIAVVQLPEPLVLSLIHISEPTRQP